MLAGLQVFIDIKKKQQSHLHTCYLSLFLNGQDFWQICSRHEKRVNPDKIVLGQTCIVCQTIVNSNKTDFGTKKRNLCFHVFDTTHEQRQDEFKIWTALCQEMLLFHSWQYMALEIGLA